MMCVLYTYACVVRADNGRSEVAGGEESVPVVRMISPIVSILLPPPSADRCRSWTRGVGVKHCCSRHRSCPRVLYILYKERRIALRFADDDDDRSPGTLLSASTFQRRV